MRDETENRAVEAASDKDIKVSGGGYGILW